MTSIFDKLRTSLIYYFYRTMYLYTEKKHFVEYYLVASTDAQSTQNFCTQAFLPDFGKKKKKV